MATEQESGSTLLGVFGLILSLFFFYMGVTRLRWRFMFDQPDYLTLGLTYIVLGMIFAGLAGYGLLSKRRGIQISGIGSVIVGGVSWLAAAYFFIQGQFLGGTVNDIFNGLTLAFGGIVLYVVGFGSGYYGKKRGLIEQDSSEDPEFNISNVADDFTESWQEGSNRGETAVNDLNSRYYQFVTSVPPLVWSVGVLLGSALSFSVWIFAGAGTENAMSIGLIGGMVMLFFSVLIDLQRVNQINEDVNFRWYVYVILATIPLIGWLFGLGWLARKRQKTGKTFG